MAPRRMDVLHQLKLFLEARVLPEDRILLAVSGGADSMGMLSLFCEGLASKAHWLTVGHVRHGIRANEATDLHVIGEYARAFGVPVLMRQLRVPELADRAKTSVEAAARKLRYAALEEMAAQSGSRWILTAHTLDDDAETVWMRMRNGGAWYEWTGIREVRGQLLRPLLSTSRTELRRWVVERSIPFVDDDTNFSMRYLRNRIRSQMTAHPSVWNDQRKQELATLGRLANRAVAVSKHLARVLPIRVLDAQSPRVVGLAIDRIFIYFKGLRFAPVEAVWSELCAGGDARLPARLRRQVNDFIAGRGPQAEMVLPGDVRLIRRGAHLWLTVGQAVQVDRSVRVGTYSVPEMSGKLEIGFSANGQSRKLSAQVLESSLRIRSWRPGDRLKMPKRPRKKVSDLLNEHELDPVTRERTLVLADEKGPLMILGGAVDERALPKAAECDPLCVTWTTNE